MLDNLVFVLINVNIEVFTFVSTSEMNNVKNLFVWIVVLINILH